MRFRCERDSHQNELMSLFSVIIPTYNRASLIAETLDSVFAQTFSDYEVIVVDDGSTDDTTQVLEAYVDRVRLLRQATNKGPGAARNLGAAAAQGRYLAFLDSDDLWFPWTLQTYEQVITRKGYPALIVGQTVRFDSTESLQQYTACEVRSDSYSDFLEASQRSIFFGSYGCTCRDNFLKAGAFEEHIRVFEDQDLGLRLGTLPGFVKIRKPITVGYRNTKESLTTISEEVFKGLNLMISRELTNAYPGGKQRKWQRRNYISFSIRSASVGFLKQRKLREAWLLYRRRVMWQLRLCRLRYVIGFPVMLLAARFR
jgi:glycosyltransferase involved in cell wall biosynthesis